MRFRHGKLGVALAALAIATLALVPPAAAKRPPKAPAHGARGCSSLNSLVDAPDPLVRPFVPERFTPREGIYPGHIGLVVNTLFCDQVLVNGKSLGPAHMSVFWVLIEAPDGSRGDHLYEAWRLTDNRKLAVALARHGVRADLATITLETQPPTPLGAVTESEVQWDGGSSYSAAGIEPEADPTTYYTQPSAYTLWQLRDEGLVKMEVVDNFIEPSNVTEVDGYFMAEPGTEFAQMIGAAQPTNHALFTEYEYDVEITAGIK
ncbi:MAG TPA: hypothetical protein VG318_17285 [Actinomycetota bacterium]|nr:hypothetical protein [Actinomycetota bacterium]